MALTKIACAEDINFGKNPPSTQQVIEAFKPAAAKPDDEAIDNDYEGDIEQNRKTRSTFEMNNLDASPKASNKKLKKTIHQTLRKVSTEVAISQEIYFVYKSAELTDAAKVQLKPVGEALVSDELHNLDFVVEGHTDAIGGYAYNKNLSEERAKSVKNFLVNQFHIEPSRIRIIGKGKTDLLDPKNPESEVNRRVRIVATK